MHITRYLYLTFYYLLFQINYASPGRSTSDLYYLSPLTSLPNEGIKELPVHSYKLELGEKTIESVTSYVSRLHLDSVVRIQSVDFRRKSVNIESKLPVKVLQSLFEDYVVESLD